MPSRRESVMMNTILIENDKDTIIARKKIKSWVDIHYRSVGLDNSIDGRIDLERAWRGEREVKKKKNIERNISRKNSRKLKWRRIINWLDDIARALSPVVDDLSLRRKMIFGRNAVFFARVSIDRSSLKDVEKSSGEFNQDSFRSSRWIYDCDWFRES